MACALTLALTVTGCRSDKTATSGLGKEELAAAKDRYEAVVARNFAYDNLQAKMKYSLGGRGLNGKLNIEHGKRLCMTVTILGIEVARVEADQQTVTVVDKVDKVYARMSVTEAAAKLGLEDEAQLEAVEALLLGRMYVPGRGVAEAGDFGRLVWYPMEDNELQADYVTERYQLSYVLSSNNQLVATQVKVPERNSTVVWEYAEPQQVAEGWMPGEESLTMTGTKNVSASLTISSPSTSKKSWTSFDPGTNYREVTLAELVEMIKKMKN